MDWLEQDKWPLRLEWGPPGAVTAARRGDTIVIIDVLSFTTTTTAAIGHGAEIIPFPWGDEARATAEAERLGARLSTGDGEDKSSRRALSPIGFGAEVRGERFLLCSPNGATLSRMAASAPAVYAGCINNADALATYLREHASGAITLVPCGERWPEALPGTDDRLRPSIEDLLGAGAIAEALDLEGSPEVQLARDAFRAAKPNLATRLAECISGRELIERGYADDVSFAGRLSVTSAVPVLRGDRYVAAAP